MRVHGDYLCIVTGNQSHPVAVSYSDLMCILYMSKHDFPRVFGHLVPNFVPKVCTNSPLSTVKCRQLPGFLKVGRTMMRSQLDAIHRGEVFVAGRWNAVEIGWRVHRW